METWEPGSWYILELQENIWESMGKNIVAKYVVRQAGTIISKFIKFTVLFRYVYNNSIDIL